MRPLDDLLPKTDTRLDWNPRLDERSRKFNIRQALATQPEVNKLWSSGPVIDQGHEGACVGFGWTGELMASPMPDYDVPEHVANRYALGWYNRAKQIDEWDGVDYDGTSVLAGAKVGKERGAFDGYYWAFDMEAIRNAVIAAGPVVIGVPWYNSMYDTAANGLVTVDTASGLAGGHCLVLTGYRHHMRFIVNHKYEYKRVFRWRNSWGRSYGVLNSSTGLSNGNGWITYDDLSNLFEMWGTEACIPVGRHRINIG